MKKINYARRCCLTLSVFSFIAIVATAKAQVVGIAVDPKAELVHGETKIISNPPPDSVAFFEFSGMKYKRLGTVQAPVSFIGPPSSVAITEDKTLALVSSSSRLDPANPKKFAPDNKISVIDLKASPIKVVQTLELQTSPTSVAIHPAGTWALVVNGTSESVTVLTISDHKVSVGETLPLPKGSSPSAVAFSPDGKQALISFAGNEKVGVFAVEDGRLKLPALREMTAGYYPAALAYCGSSGFAVVGNYGRGGGDADTVSLIDAAASVPRIVDTVSVGPSPEGVACSPDGKYVVASVQNMSSVKETNPLYSPHSLAVLLKIEDRRLHRIGGAPFGGWSQGIGFLDDSKTIFAESIGDRSVHFFQIEGDALKEVAPPMVFENGAPVAYGVSGR